MGLLLLREFDEKHGFSQGISECIVDRRHPDYIVHEMEDLVRERLYMLVYLQHHDPDEYNYKQKALVDDLRRISGYLENLPNSDNLDVFWDSIPYYGPFYKILCHAFSNMDRQASAR